MYRFGLFQFDPAQGLDGAGRRIHLTPKSLAVLWLLVRRAGQVVTKEEVFAAVWPDTAVSDAALTSCIQELRGALDDDARRPRYIETVHRRGFRFIGRLGDGARTGVPVLPCDAPLVGRTSVLQALDAAFARARRGERQLVFLSGPPGVGKTSVLHAFLRSTVERDATVSGGSAVEHHGPAEPYGPLLETLMRLGRQADGARAVATLAHCAPSWLAQLPGLLSPAEHVELQRRTSGATRERMLRELSDAIEQLAAAAPLVIWLEDLHWADTSTLDLLAAFARRPDRARVLLVGTFRRDEMPAQSATFDAVLSELRVKGLCREIELGGLDPAAFEAFVRVRHPPADGAGAAMASLAAQVRELTDGNPLFGMHVLADVVERRMLVEEDGRWRLADSAAGVTLEVPRDVRRAIEGQLERLAPSDRELLRAASAAGISCPAAAVAAAVQRDVAAVESELALIAAREQFIAAAGDEEWPDGTLSGRFRFMHSLHREVLYAALPPGRRREVHRRIGLRLEAAFGDRARERAPELAAHFERGRDLPRAIAYLTDAARTAARRSALQEAEHGFARALSLLASLPPSSARDEREIALRVELGAVLMGSRGWGVREVETTYLRARELCAGFGDTPHLFTATWGLWLFYWGRGAVRTAAEIAGTLQAMARRSGEAELRLQAAHALWATAFSKGDVRAAHEHAVEGASLYVQEQHAALAGSYGNHDAGVCARVFDARALALLGRDADAVRAAEEGVALARRLGHPFTLALALVFAAALHQFRDEPPDAARHAAEASAIAEAHGFALMLAWAMTLGGWAGVRLTADPARLAIVAEGLQRAARTGSDQFRSHLLGVAADAHLHVGRLPEARAFVDEALRLAHARGERFYEAELHRLDAELHLAQGREPAAAHHALEQAIAVAQSQGAALFAARSERRLRTLGAGGST